MVTSTGRWAAVWLLALAAAGVGMSSPVHAQTPSVQASNGSIVGFIGGLTIDPEQGFVGVFWQSPEIGNRFHLRPGIDGGFGGDIRMATINIDFLARFPLGASGWSLVQGGGPAVVITRFSGFGRSDTDVGAGGSYVIGFGHDNGVLAEFRIGGGGNVPSLKMGAGFGIRF